MSEGSCAVGDIDTVTRQRSISGHVKRPAECWCNGVEVGSVVDWRFEVSRLPWLFTQGSSGCSAHTKSTTAAKRRVANENLLSHCYARGATIVQAELRISVKTPLTCLSLLPLVLVLRAPSYCPSSHSIPFTSYRHNASNASEEFK